MTRGLSRILLLSCGVLILSMSAARANSPIDPVLQAKQPPAGVVFEIATSQANSLDWALPLVKRYITRIHQRFPNLPIAVVTHGREMFSLKKDPAHANTPAKKLTQQLVADGVSLHVCGTYAAHRGLSEEDFPSYVNVAAEGPAQIKDYVAVGYVRIRIKRPK